MSTEHPVPGRRPGTQLCVLLACFAGSTRAGQVVRALGKEITGHGDAILDELIVKVNAKRRVVAYEPRRVALSVLVPALTWGVVGLLAGGIASGGIWAIIGAVCGGPYAYYGEHVLRTDDRKRIGRSLSGDSSSIVAFVQGSDGERVLSAATAFEPAAASVAEIGADLSAAVVTGAGRPSRPSSARPGSSPLAAGKPSVLSMLLLRYRDADAAKHELAKIGQADHKGSDGVEPDMIFESPARGRVKAIGPKYGMAAMAKSSLISWGLFGLVYGLVVGIVSNHGIFSAVTDTAGAAVVCAVFGLAAGALYGLWAGRGVSARRLRGVEPLLPRGTSTLLAWSEENLTQEELGRLSEPGSRRLVLRFNPVDNGALLEAAPT